MRKLTFTVTVEFANKITDDNEINEVANNIAKAIVDRANHEGIAPENSDNYTESVEIQSETLLTESITLKVQRYVSGNKKEIEKTK